MIIVVSKKNTDDNWSRWPSPEPDQRKERYNSVSWACVAFSCIIVFPVLILSIANFIIYF
jgi:hypothetical protein